MSGDTFPIQRCGRIPLAAAEVAYRHYARRYGTHQSLARLAERGGFGLQEWACLYLGCPRIPHGEEEGCIWRALTQAGLLSAPTGDRAEPATEDRLREIEATIADYGWCYDGPVTFTVNCTSVAEAKRLQAAFAALPRRAAEPTGDDHDRS